LLGVGGGQSPKVLLIKVFQKRKDPQSGEGNGTQRLLKGLRRAVPKNRKLICSESAGWGPHGGRVGCSQGKSSHREGQCRKNSQRSLGHVGDQDKANKSAAEKGQEETGREERKKRYCHLKVTNRGEGKV